jgi:hypothetical protein
MTSPTKFTRGVPLRLAALGLALASMGWASLAASAEPVEPQWLYQVQAGDALERIVRRHLDDDVRSGVRRVARHNRLADPNLIHPGQILKLKPEWLRAERGAVRLVTVTGSVHWQTDAGAQVAARAGDELSEPRHLVVGADSSAVLDVGGGTRVVVQPNSEVAWGHHRLHARGRWMDASLKLPQGRLVVKTDRSAGAVEQRRVRIDTPSAVVAVRGTTFGVHVDEGQTWQHTLEGSTRLQSRGGGDAREVPVGQGVIVPPAGPAGDLQTIPAAPSLGGVATRVTAVPQRVRLNGFPDGAWRALIALDEEMSQLVREIEGHGPQIQDLNLPDGTYFLQIQSVAADGLEGWPAQQPLQVDIARRSAGPLRWLSPEHLPPGTVLNLAEAPAGQRWWLTLSLDDAGQRLVWQAHTREGRVAVDPGAAAQSGGYLGVWLVPDGEADEASAAAPVDRARPPRQPGTRP